MVSLRDLACASSPFSLAFSSVRAFSDFLVEAFRANRSPLAEVACFLCAAADSWAAASCACSSASCCSLEASPSFAACRVPIRYDIVPHTHPEKTNLNQGQSWRIHTARHQVGTVCAVIQPCTQPSQFGPFFDSALLECPTNAQPVLSRALVKDKLLKICRRYVLSCAASLLT